MGNVSYTPGDKFPQNVYFDAVKVGEVFAYEPLDNVYICLKISDTELYCINEKYKGQLYPYCPVILMADSLASYYQE